LTLITYEQFPSYGIKLSKQSIYRLEREGVFPRRINVTPRTSAWSEEEILAYLEQRAALRSVKKSA
jgi:predicted DNA-binding transcriptional regulator AlpA